MSSDLLDDSEADADSVNECVTDVDSDEDSLFELEGESEDDSEAECVDVELAVSDVDSEDVSVSDPLEV